MSIPNSENHWLFYVEKFIIKESNLVGLLVLILIVCLNLTSFSAYHVEERMSLSYLAHSLSIMIYTESAPMTITIVIDNRFYPQSSKYEFKP